jgi:hypothetical protein
MKFECQIKEPSFDMKGNVIANFAVNKAFLEAYEEFKGCEKITLEIKKYKKKRSLDANAYYWVLITKLAKRTRKSNEELHNEMLVHYGFPELVDGQLIRMVLPDTDEADKTVRYSSVYHLKPTTQVKEGKDGTPYRTYIMLRGSHTYNTEEMARLIDGLIYECKSEGMAEAEIASPEEQRILKERYGVNIG